MGYDSSRCLNPQFEKYFALLVGAIGVLSDFPLAVILWIYISKLHMALRERIAVGVALSLGFGAGAFTFKLVLAYLPTCLQYSSSLNPKQ